MNVTPPGDCPVYERLRCPMNPTQAFLGAIRASVLARASVDKYEAGVKALDAGSPEELAQKLGELSEMAETAAEDFRLTSIALKQAASVYTQK